MTLSLPASYVDAHRYDGAAIEHGRRDALVPCAVQPRDVAIVRDVWRYKFLTAPQLRELWWPDARPCKRPTAACSSSSAPATSSASVPYARRGAGSYPGPTTSATEGHRLLQHAGVIADGRRYRRRPIFDYGHVLHELQLNAWVSRTAAHSASGLLAWEGETSIEPPTGLRHDQQRFDDDWSAEGLSDPRARSVCPDAVLEIAGDDPTAGSRLILVEYDRTRRLDKNFEKFQPLRRLPDLVVASHAPRRPRVRRRSSLFVCQDEEQREQFLDAADRELTGHRWHPDVAPERYEYVGRQRILFTAELDAHAGVLEAWRLPAFPRGHRARRAEMRRVQVAPLSARIQTHAVEPRIARETTRAA